MEKEVFKWSCRNEAFNIWLQGKHVHTKNKIITLDKAQQVELLDLIASGRHDISAEITFLDEKAAEDIAKAHQANQRGAAHQGSAHSQANAEKASATSGSLMPIKPQEPAGMSLSERLAAQRENVLAAAKEQKLKPIEEGAVHASDIAPASTADTEKK